MEHLLSSYQAYQEHLVGFFLITGVLGASVPRVIVYVALEIISIVLRAYTNSDAKYTTEKMTDEQVHETLDLT